MVFRLATGAVAEVVVPLGLAKVGFLSGCTGVLGIVAAAEVRGACTVILNEIWVFTLLYSYMLYTMYAKIPYILYMIAIFN